MPAEGDVLLQGCRPPRCILPVDSLQPLFTARVSRHSPVELSPKARSHSCSKRGGRCCGMPPTPSLQRNVCRDVYVPTRDGAPGTGPWVPGNPCKPSRAHPIPVPRSMDSLSFPPRQQEPSFPPTLLLLQLLAGCLKSSCRGKLRDSGSSAARIRHSGGSRAAMSPGMESTCPPPHEPPWGSPAVALRTSTEGHLGMV